MFDIFSNIFSGFKKKDIDVRGAAFRDEVQEQVGFPIALVCRDDLPYPHKRAWDLTAREWGKRRKAILNQMVPEHGQYWEEKNFLARDYCAEYENNTCFFYPSERSSNLPAYMPHKPLKDLKRFSGQSFAHYACNELRRTSAAVVFYGVAPETPETYKHSEFPAALKAERVIASDRGHLGLWHELGHMIFRFSCETRGDDNIYYANEMLPDLYSIMQHRNHGGKEEVIRDRINLRALDAFTYTDSSYFTAPACEAFLKGEPIPSYQQVRAAYRELQMRSFIDGFKMADSYRMSCDDVCAKLGNVTVVKDGERLSKEASSFMSDRDGTLNCFQKTYAMTVLYRVMDRTNLDPFTYDIGRGVLEAFDSFCPTKAAQARKDAYVAKDFCVRPERRGVFYSLPGPKV
ncbi:MAG: hypothetical protein FWF24_05675 [Alphaproteobacteria bacterium]|nr:hypothetical protein [Alphaproteobacteria bacterium]